MTFLYFTDSASQYNLSTILVSDQLNLMAPELFFFNFSTPSIYNVNNTGTKYVRFMKQTAF